MGSNPFDDVLEELDQQPASSDPYQDTLDSRRRNRQVRLQTSIGAAAETTPDRAAHVKRLSGSTGLPAPFIERNFEAISKRVKLSDPALEDIDTKAPALAAWLENPTNAAVSQDDVPTLTALERTVQIGRNLVGAAGAGVMQFSSGMWGFLQQQSEAARMTPMYGGTPLASEILGRPGVADFAAGAAHVAKVVADRWRGRQEGAGFVEKSVYSGVESVGMMAPAMMTAVLGGGEAAVLSAMGLTTSGLSYLEAKDQGADQFKANLFAAIDGAVEVATEKIPVHWLLKDLKEGSRFLKTLLHQAASEIPTEEVATVLQDLNAWAMLPANADRTFSDYLDERPSAAAATLISTFVVVGLTAGAGHGTRRLVQQLGKSAEASETLKRSPEAVQELVEQAAEGGATTLYQDVYEWADYWQKLGVDPRAKAAEVLGDAAAYDTAIQTGQDLPIPLARYAVTLAATEHNAYFADRVRIEAGATNGLEADAALAERLAELQTDADGAAADTAGPADGLEALRQDLLAQMTRAGYDRVAAQTNVNIVMRAANLAIRAGLDPVTELSRYGLKIERTTFEAYQAAREAERQARRKSAGAAEASAQAPGTAEVGGATPASGGPTGEAVSATPADVQGEGMAADSGAASPPMADSPSPDDVLDGLQPIEGGNTLDANGETEGATQAGRGVGRGNARGRDGVSGSPAEPVQVGPVGTAATPGGQESRTERGTEQVPSSWRGYFGTLLVDARANGFDGSDNSLADQFLSFLADAKRAADDLNAEEAGPSASDLLYKIASLGGLGIEAEGSAGMSGEMEHLLESLTRQGQGVRRRDGRAMPKQFRQVGKVPGGSPGQYVVRRKGGKPADRILEGVREDPRWEGQFENLADFMQAVADAVAIETGMMQAPGGGRYSVEGILAGVYDVRPGAIWWSRPAGSLQILEPGGAENNGSGESAASLEAINRQKSMSARGESFVVYDKSGQRRVLIGPEAVDYVAQAGETYGVEGPGGFRVLDDLGGAAPAAVAVNLLEATTFEAEVAESGVVYDLDDTSFDPVTFEPFDPNPPVEVVAAAKPVVASELPAGQSEHVSGLPVGTEFAREWKGERVLVRLTNSFPNGETWEVSRDRGGRPTLLFHEGWRFVREDTRPIAGATEDLLATGETQPRLPGAESVRDQEITPPAVAELRDAFDLTAPPETDETQTEMFQPVYHGSPHIFDRFSLQHIGTGEGAQSFGWGLYFAGRKEIAEHYRSKLTADAFRLQLAALSDEDNEILPESVRLDLSGRFGAAFASPQAALRAYLSDYADRIKVLRTRLAGEEGVHVTVTPADRNRAERALPRYEQILSVLTKLEAAGDLTMRPETPGRVYKVEIPEDDVMLHWDRPASEQPEAVRQALKSLGVTWETFKPKSVKQMARWLEGPTAARLWREDIGIRESLREAAKYVEENRADELRTWQQLHQGYFNQGAVDTVGERIYAELGRRLENEDRERRRAERLPSSYWDMSERAQATSELLRQAGIAGIKYLDGSSRAKGEGSYNYVLFDDSQAKIVEFWQDDEALNALTQFDLDAWAAEVKRQTPDLLELDLRLNREGAVILDTIAVTRGGSNAGVGTAVMQAVIKMADERGVRLELALADKGYTPAEGSATTSSRSRLEAFYRRFGFVRNAGRHKRFDLSIYASMYREPTLRGRRELFQPFFHGTPHNVDRFSTDKIGTGEGAAAYGWGLYFAENPVVATGYHERLAGESELVELRLGSMRLGLHNDWSYSRRASESTLENIRSSLAEDVLLQQSELRARAGQAQDFVLEMLDEKIAQYKDEWPEGVKPAQDLRAMLARPGAVSAKFEGATTGGVYQVDIDDAQVARMVRWEAPLKEQPAAVKKVARELLVSEGYLKAGENGPIQLTRAWAAYKMAKGPHAGGDGGDLYYAIANSGLAGQIMSDGRGVTAERAASEFLLSRGIPGLMYLDADSRDAGKGTKNVVVFDDSIITITHKDGTPVTQHERNNYLEELNQVLEGGRQRVPRKRGSIRFGRQDRQIIISLFEQANLSTFLHEAGHFYLEVFGDVVDTLAKMEPSSLNESQRKLMADYRLLLESLGIERREEIKREHHETFARMVEAYLMEGNAPAEELRPVFARIRAWMLDIYQSLKSLRVSLSPEVRGVFDRMLATDAEIFAVEQQEKIVPLFMTAEAAGKTEPEFRLYREEVEAASRVARERLEAKVVGELRREQTAAWRTRRDEVESQVRAEVQAEPVYRAIHAMRHGTTPAGEPLLEGFEPEPLVLNRERLVDLFGRERLKRLPRPAIHAPGGQYDPEIVADMFDFSSADEMLTALEMAPKMEDKIRHETQRRMLAEFGSVLLDGNLYERAKSAVANDRREAVIRAEIRALRQLERKAKPFIQAGEDALAAERRERAYERRWLEAEGKLMAAIARQSRQTEIDELRKEVRRLKAYVRGGARQMREGMPTEDAVRAAARKVIAGLPVKSIKPATYWVASRKASQLAVEAAATGNYSRAILLKGQEMLNLALYRTATDALEDVEKRVKAARELSKGPRRARIGLAGQGILEQVDAILDRFDFARVSLKALEQRTSLADWIAEQERNGQPIDLPDEVINEARRTPYQALTFEQFVGVSDALKHLEHVARQQNRLLKAEKQRSLDEAADEIVDSIVEHAKRRVPVPIETRLPQDQIKRGFAGFNAWQRKISSLAREMDGGIDGGPMWEYLIRPINAASDAETVEVEKAALAFLDAIKAFNTDDLISMNRKVAIPEIGDSMTRAGMIMVGLNWGNEGNRQRLLSGYKWTQAQGEAVLSRLNERDWKFIKASWAQIQSYGPAIVAKQKRVYGVAPEMVEASPFMTKFGEMPGGYFPIVYDTESDPKAFAKAVEEVAARMMAGAVTNATTKRGFTKARVKKVSGRRLQLDLSVVWRHVAEVVHDLTHHEMLIDVNRLLRHPKVSQAIREHYGMPVYRELQAAIKDIAAGDIPVQHHGERALEWVRVGTSVARMGYNAMTAIVQPLGASVGFTSRIGPVWMARGAARWLGDAARMEGTVAWIWEQSPMMRLRHKTMSREISEVRNKIQPRGAWVLSTLGGKIGGTVGAKAGFKVSQVHAAIEDTYFSFIVRMQRFADTWVWLAEHAKASADPANDAARVIALADQAVLDTQGSGMLKDLAHSMRGTPALKIFSQFMGYFSVVYNQGAEAQGRTRFKYPIQVARLGADLLTLYTIPMLIEETIRGMIRGDDDKDEDGVLLWFAKKQTVYLLNTVMGFREFTSAIEGYDYKGAAGAGIFAEGSAALIQVGQGEVDEAALKAVNNTLGILFHYPATQVERLVRAFIALEDQGVVEAMRAAVGRKPPKD